MKLYVKPYWQREDGWAATTTAIVLAVGAAVSSAVGAYTAGTAQKQAQDFNAKVAQNNAAAAEQQAAAQAQLIAQKNQRLKGAQIAAMAANGLDTSSSSGQDVQYDSAVSGELNRLTTLYQGKVQSTNYNAQALGDQAAGNNALTAGYMGVGTSLLSGAAQGSSLYMRSRSNPTFDYTG